MADKGNLPAEKVVARITAELGRTKRDYPQLYRSMDECQDIAFLLGQLQAIKKRIRAEVLAACLGVIQEQWDYLKEVVLEKKQGTLDEEDWAYIKSLNFAVANCEKFVTDLRELQPAAADLEELLREEWNKAIDAAAASFEKAQPTVFGPGKMEREVGIERGILCLRKEKARAIGGKG